MKSKSLFVGSLVLIVLLMFGCTTKQPTNETGVYVSFFNESEENATNATQEPALVVIEEENKTPTGEVVTEVENKTVVEETTIKETTTTQTPTTIEAKPGETGIPVKKFTEGDLVELTVKAIDPDNDLLTIYYSPPLDENGKWQTKVGDAGTYRVNITVSDGKTNVSKEVLMIIEPKNRPPVIKIDNEITVMEGQTVHLAPVITDPDNDSVSVTYTGWMTQDNFTTTYEDAGSYIVTVIASDGVNTVAKDVKVNVVNVNRPPVIEDIPAIRVVEGELIQLKPKVIDPDGDSVKLSFSPPLDENGNWQTTEGDADTYQVKVTATDGIAVVSKNVSITVEPKNQPPVIQRMSDIVVNEGETVKIQPIVIDPDGDPFTITYSGWMTSAEKQTGYDDAGTYIVTVTATDNKGSSSSQKVKIIVNDVNRPPEVKIE